MNEPQLLAALFGVMVVVLSVAFFNHRFALRRRGSVDFQRWRSLAESRGWSFTATTESCRMVARVHGAQVICNAVGTYVGRANLPEMLLVRNPRHNPANDALVVATSVVVPIVGAPPGFSLRPRSMADSVTSLVGSAVALRDEGLSAAIVATGEEAAVHALMEKPGVREAILGLVGYGTLSADGAMIQLTAGDLVGNVDLEILVERMAALAALIGVAEAEVRPMPIPTAPAVRRPRLATLVQRVASTATTKFGMQAADDLTGRAVIIEIELDTLHLRHGLADGSQGVMLVGTEVRGTTRAEISARASFDEIRRMMPGCRVSAEAILERYDGLRDRAELHADGPLTISPDPEPSAHRQREAAFAALADEVGLKTDLSPVLEVLATASATRARLLVHIAGREYHGEFVPIKQNSLRDGFVPEAARNGTSWTGLVGKREAEILVPPGIPAPDGPVRVQIVRWDEFGGRPVLLALPPDVPRGTSE